MTLRSSDLQSDSDLDSIRNSCDVFNVEVNLSNKSVLSALTLFMLFSLSVYNYIPIFYQGGRTWQPFAGSKNGKENLRQAGIYNIRVKKRI